MPAQHTPGPWTTAGIPATLDTAHWPIGGYASDDGRAVMIATAYPITDDGQPGGECEANARLIAKAPELLDTCHAAAGRLRYLADNATPMHPHIRGQLRDIARDLFRTAAMATLR